MTINQQLETLYRDKLHNIEPLFEFDHEIDGPLIMNAWEDEYINSQVRILFIGQECDGWIGWTVDKFEELNNKYIDFGLSKKGDRTVFWQYVYYVNSILNPNNAEGNNFLWTNVSKFCMWDGKPLDWTTHQTTVKHFDCLKEEIRILKPDVVLFFSGPFYDDKIKLQFDTDISFEQVDNEIPLRELAILKNENLPKHTYRTYHPKPMQMLYKTGHLEIILNKIKSEIGR
ncbi:hypothetical protein [Aridibaculum aurantiacum]|uniref:hypothetical protein n=1 Tax=Aridibaculum aurantiacum TaxID=2810307 RepID=UPI001A96B8FC|nr:hypothetical protein [Aridibaculum aurantiacum]